MIINKLYTDNLKVWAVARMTKMWQIINWAYITGKTTLMEFFSEELS